jgi:CBS domain-containing protein
VTVHAILAEKGRTIVTARPEQTVGAVCHLLAEKRIGAVLVLDAGDRIAGILSERDVVRALARDGAAALERPVSGYMTRSVQTCSPHDTIAEVMAWMTTGRFRHLPVVEDGRLIGVVSIGDVVKHRIAQAEREAEEMRTYIHTA